MGARQNWRLGQEIAQRGSATDGDGSTDSSPASASKGQEIQSGDAKDSDGECRPGMKRLPLPLKKKGAQEAAAPTTTPYLVDSAESSSEPPSDLEEPDKQHHVRPDRAMEQGSEARRTNSERGGKKVQPAEEGRPSQQNISPHQHTCVGNSTTSTAKSALVSFSFATASVLGIGLMATFTLGRLLALNNGEDFEL